MLHCLEIVRQTRRTQALGAGPEIQTGLDVYVPALSGRVASKRLAHLVSEGSGTGASAIYPLLAVRYAASRAPQDFANLRMLATDVNDKSLALAKSNVERNGLAEAISVYRVEPDGPIFPPAVIDAASQYVADASRTRTRKRCDPNDKTATPASNSRCVTRHFTIQPKRSLL